MTSEETKLLNEAYDNWQATIKIVNSAVKIQKLYYEKYLTLRNKVGLE